MTIAHECFIPGQPVAKGRPRFTRTGHAYTPAKTQRWEEMAALVLRTAIGTPMYDCKLRLDVTAFFARPKRLDKDGSIYCVHHTSRPDADNILKAVCDALQKAGVVRDDSCICKISCEKFYTTKGDEPEVHIILEEIPGQ